MIDKAGIKGERSPLDVKGQTARTDRRALASWIAREVIPHEAAVRTWLRQRVRSPSDADDLIQEAYAKLADLTAFNQITRPQGYFFQIVRNLLIDHVRRDQIVRFDAVGHIDDLPALSDDMDPERITASRRELSRVMRLIETLPDRCREIFKLRKVEGLSQREIATRLGVTESIVENDGVKGLALLIRAIRSETYGNDRENGDVV